MDRGRPAERSGTDPGAPAVPRPSASVVLVRDGRPGLELLLVRRSPAQRVMGGHWVFPGGTLDAGESPRAAAVRELREEAGIDGVQPSELVEFSHWITPEAIAARFDARFYVARAPAGARARVDGRECVAARWCTPREALARARRGELPLAFPTRRQLEQLAAFATAAELLAHAAAAPVTPVMPRLVHGDEGPRIVLPGEPGYGG